MNDKAKRSKPAQQSKSHSKGTSPSDMQQKARSAANKQRRIEKANREAAKAAIKREQRKAQSREHREAKRQARQAARDAADRAKQQYIDSIQNERGVRITVMADDTAQSMVARWLAHRDAMALKNKQARGA